MTDWLPLKLSLESKRVIAPSRVVPLLSFAKRAVDDVTRVRLYLFLCNSEREIEREREREREI